MVKNGETDLGSGIYRVKGFKKVPKSQATYMLDPYDFDNPLYFTAEEVEKVGEIYETSSMVGPIVVPTQGWDTIIVALNND